MATTFRLVFDPKARIGEQTQDGVAADVSCPSPRPTGHLLGGHD